MFRHSLPCASSKLVWTYCRSFWDFVIPFLVLPWRSFRLVVDHPGVNHSLPCATLTVFWTYLRSLWGFVIPSLVLHWHRFGLIVDHPAVLVIHCLVPPPSWRFLTVLCLPLKGAKFCRQNINRIRNMLYLCSWRWFGLIIDHTGVSSFPPSHLLDGGLGLL